MTDNPTSFENLFISAGAMKSGTTWLQYILSRNSQLLFTPEKEINYFYAKYANERILSQKRRLEKASRFVSRVLESPQNIDRVRYQFGWWSKYLSRPLDDHWYADLFQLKRKHQYGCDFSNLYALLPDTAWSEITKESRKLRVLYTMRRPVDRLWSHIKYSLTATNELELLSTWGPAEYEEFVRRPHMWRHAEYGQAIGRMKKGLASDQLMIAYFEDMRTDPRRIVASIENFLQISAHGYTDDLLHRRVNETISLPMPEFLNDIFRNDFQRITREIEDHGYAVPVGWDAC